jgi:ribosome-binding factor A
MGAEHTTRVRRVAEGIRVELAALLGEGGDVKDPGAAGAIITRVEMTNDLQSAKVFVRLLEGGDQEDRRKRLLDALARARGMLRREVTQRLALRHAPELRFKYDEGLDRTTRVEELLAEIEADRKK